MRYFIFTTHKAASRFLDSFARALGQAKGLPVFQPEQKNLPREFDLPRMPEAVEKDGVYGSLRYPFAPARTQDDKTLVHLRDPRDALVSLYYSHAFIHPRGEGKFKPSAKVEAALNQGIDHYALFRAPEYVERYRMLLQMAEQPNTLFSSYERLVTDFRDWYAATMEFFDVSSEDPVYQSFFKSHCSDFAFDGSERLDQHRRKGLPGDHAEKLRPGTIDQLNDIFAAELVALSTLNLVPERAYSC